MNWIDITLILSYFGFLFYVGISGKKLNGEADENYMLSSRTLSLPAFVATLVSTWYGSILAVGEFSFSYGIAQWTVFGLPYYVFAILYAWIIVPKVREGTFVSLPEAVHSVYGKKGSAASALSIFILVNPAPYLLMVGLMLVFFTGFDSALMLFVIASAIFSSWYIMNSGFSAVVRTDVLQFVLMFAGFIALFAFSWVEIGSPLELLEKLPESYKDLDGGLSILYLSVWFFIALWTFVDPGFFQRTAAAKSSKVAQKGILWSLLFWTIFDFLTVFCGLYGFVHLPELKEAALVYPELARSILPVGVRGLFFVGILATIMSTLDSFLFLSGQTIARDFMFDDSKNVSIDRIKKGIWLSAGFAVILVWLIPNVVDLIYVLGSLVVPGLLITMLGVFFTSFRVQKSYAAYLLGLPIVIAAIWYAVSQTGWMSASFSEIPPFYPGLLTALEVLLFSKLTKKA